MTSLESVTYIQNRCQKVFYRGVWNSAEGICLCGGLDIIKLTKILLIYSVSHYNSGVLEFFWGGLNPPKPPVATGLPT